VDNTDELTYGIDTHMDAEENERLGNLLKIPFQPYRTPEGTKFGEKEALNVKVPSWFSDNWLRS